jgi:hypothetical protein
MITTTDADGEELGDREAAGLVAGIPGATFGAYSRQRRPIGNPAPRPVSRDLDTGRQLYRLREVREWAARRPGSGRRRLD